LISPISPEQTNGAFICSKCSKMTAALNATMIKFKVGLALVALAGLLTDLPSHAAEGILAAIRVVPRETAVLLLPALDATRDAKNMQAPRQLVIRHREEYEFITRQFKMLGEAMAARAADAGPKIELGNLSARTAANLDLLAKRTGAEWVVSVIVEGAGLDSSVEGDFKVQTHVRLQVWDARRRGWLVNASYTARVSGGGSPVFVFKNSLDQAVKGSLGNFLNVYRQIVSVSQESSLKDYLKGQTRPFVGDPKRPFSGLNAGK
jgi:hypothetical protein